MINVTIVLLAIYFLVVIGIGYYCKRAAKTGSAFIIASHKAGFWRVSASLFTLLGGGELVTMTSLSYSYSYAAMWFFGGVAVGFLTLAVIVPKIRTDENLSRYTGLADFFHERFGRAAGMSAACVIVLAFFSLLMVQFVVGGSLLATFLGWSYPLVILCMSAVIVIYLSMGGYEAVLGTDVLQAVVMISFGLVVLFTLPYASVSAVPSNAMPTAMPTLDSIIFFSTAWLAIIASADIWQIVFASRSVKVARGGLIASAIGFFVFGLFLSYLGNITRSVIPSLATPDEAFNSAITNVLPSAILPFGIIFVFAAVMSTADTEIFVVTRTIVREFHRRKSLTIDENAERGLTIAGTSYVAIVGALLAIFFTEQLQLVYFTIIGLVVALSPSMFAYWFFRPPSIAVILSILAAPISLLTAFFLGLLSPASAPLVALVGSVAGFLIGLIISISGKKSSNQIEVNQ